VDQREGARHTLETAYDRFGNRDGLTFTDGSDVLTHGWTFNDDLDRLTQATLAGASPLGFQYRANDELETLTHASGVTTTLGYHPHGPIDTITVEDPSSALLHDLDYTVDAVLNVDTIQETRGAASPELLDYAYDGVDRLIQAQLPTAYGLPAQQDYAYDDAGNREAPSDPSAFDYDANNRIQTGPSGTSWTFDADGNVATRTIGGVEERFTFDRTNRLRAWEPGPVGSPTATASYRYDPFGRRLEKTVDGTTTWFLWDGDDLLAEFDGSGTRTRRYAYAGGFAPLQVIDPAGGGGETAYEVHTDHLDTPRLLTDASGEVVWQAGYQAYGEAAVDEDPDGDGTDLAFHVRFPGQYRDAETELHYNRHRYYDPAIGRYVSADPIGQFGAVAGDVGLPALEIQPWSSLEWLADAGFAGAHLYTYGDNQPLGVLDPLGLFGFTDVPNLPQGFVNFSAGLGDALLLGAGGPLRAATGAGSVVNQCSPAYAYGSYAALAAGLARAGYAVAAKAGAAVASSGVAAHAFRNTLKTALRGGAARGYRSTSYSQALQRYGSDAAVKAAAGRTNTGINAYGAGVAGAAALGGAANCGCPQ